MVYPNISAPPELPICSVCIANYNGTEYLSDCLESILSQDFNYEVEIIVHDDASTDDSVSLLRNQYPQVILLESSENVGFCISNNRMVSAAKGKYILLLNNDAILHRDALKTFLQASDKFGDGIFGLPQYHAQTGELIDRGSFLDIFYNAVPNTNAAKIDVAMIIGACLWLPKTLWDTIGGFPEWFGSLAEDMYICGVARLWGYPVKALSKSGFDHWVGTSFGGGKISKNNSLATTYTRRTLSERNKTFVMISTCPAPAIYFLVPFHLFLLFIEGILLSLIKQNSALFKRIYWNCLVQVWCRRKKLRKQRKMIQSRRKCGAVTYFMPFTLVPYKLKMLIKHGIPYLK